LVLVDTLLIIKRKEVDFCRERRDSSCCFRSGQTAPTSTSLVHHWMELNKKIPLKEERVPSRKIVG
jgi:hypothetical protein